MKLYRDLIYIFLGHFHYDTGDCDFSFYSIERLL